MKTYYHPRIAVRLAQAKRERTRRMKLFWARLSWRTLGVASLATLLAGGGSIAWFYRATDAITPPLVLGELPYQKLLSQPLTDRAALLVNMANGNAILKTQDLNIQSVGPGLSVSRYFNDRAAGAGQAGDHTTLSVGADVSITANANGSATYQGPSGFKVTFSSNGSGGYTTPIEFSGAKLTSVSGGGWKLTFNQTGDTYTFNAAGKQTRHANAAGLGIDYAYNANNTLASATDAQGKTTYFTNYNGTNVGTITDPAGRTVNYRYTNGQLTGVTDASGGNWAFQYYDGRGNLNQITDPRGYTTTMLYDTDNRVTTIRYNDYTSAMTTWTYAYNNGNTAVTDPLNHTSTYTYDTQGRVIGAVNGVGDHAGTSWDANNNQASTTDPSNQVTTTVYDQSSRLTKRQNPNTSGGMTGASENYDYLDATQPYRPSKKTDAAGNTTAYSYNANGSVTGAASASAGGTAMGTTTSKYQGDPNGGSTVTCGAKAGQICSSTDARGNTTTYAYDANGNVTTVTPPSPLGVRSYTYDNLARVQTMTDGNNSKVTISYDSADRPTDLSYAKDGTNVTYNYDAHGNLQQRNDAAGQTNWTYDGFNRITQLQQSGKPTLTYTYDAVGNIKTEQGPGGTVTYGYDAANQVTGVAQSATGSSESFAYAAGRLMSITLPGGITQSLAYDNSGRQTSIKATKGASTLTNFTGTYAKTAGTDTALLQKESDVVAGITSTYGYDGLNRLTSVTGSGTGSDSYTYTYDKTGNRTQYTKNGVASAVWGFNAANQLTTTNNGTITSTYDPAGNQTALDRGLALTYNAKSQTTSMTPTGGSTTNFAYSDVGQTGRTQRGSTAQQNGLLGLYSETTGSTTTYYHYLPGGTVLGQITGASGYYFLKDLRGSVVNVVDGSGAIKNTYTYDPAGTRLTSTATITSPWSYASSYRDEAGFYKMGARYYNSRDARWTQLDPSGQQAGYIYAGDNPVNFVDPSGYITLSGVTGGLGATIGASILIGLCPETAGITCLAAGAVGGAAGGFYGTLAGGGSLDEARENTAYGAIGGASQIPAGKAIKTFLNVIK